VQMATRFVATEECDASLNFKLAYINAKKEDIVITSSPVGMPGRAIMNHFMRDVRSGITKPNQCPLHCIKTCDYQKSPYCIFLALMNAQKGLIDKGLVFAGENAFRINQITSVKQLFEELINEYSEYANTQKNQE